MKSYWNQAARLKLIKTHSLFGIGTMGYGAAAKPGIKTILTCTGGGITTLP